MGPGALGGPLKGRRPLGPPEKKYPPRKNCLGAWKPPARTRPHCIALSFIELHCIALHWMALHGIAIHYMHDIAIRCMTLRYMRDIALYCTAWNI